MEKIKIEFTKEELMQLSLSVVVRIGVVETLWGAVVQDDAANRKLLGTMNELQALSAKLDSELKKLDNGEN